MAKKSHLKDVQEDAKSDMTPMIDAVFLLIIFFLCIEFKTLEAKLAAYLPKDRGSASTSAEPVEQLSIRIVNTNWGTEVPRKSGSKAFRLENHVCHWEVGPKRYDSMEDLRKELTKIYEDPRRRVLDKDTGGQKAMPVVIEPQPGVTYGDVASVVDVVHVSGFDEINFGGGRGRRKTN